MTSESHKDIMDWLEAIALPPEYNGGFILPNGTKYSGYKSVGSVVRSLLSETGHLGKKVDGLQVEKQFLWKALHEIRGTVRDAIGEDE